jgi:hypothetical protein
MGLPHPNFRAGDETQLVDTDPASVATSNDIAAVTADVPRIVSRNYIAQHLTADLRNGTLEQTAQQNNSLGRAAQALIQRMQERATRDTTPAALPAPASTPALPSPAHVAPDAGYAVDESRVVRPVTYGEAAQSRAALDRAQRLGLTSDVVRAQQARDLSREPEPTPAETAPGQQPATPPVPDEATGSVAPPETAQPDQAVLQNRDRSTAAAIQQMNAIAANPDPHRLGFSRDFTNGAPVVEANPSMQIPEDQLGREDISVAADGRRIPVRYAVVDADSLLPSHTADGTPVAGYEKGQPDQLRAIAGNGRVAGLQAAYDRGTTGAYAQATDPEARTVLGGMASGAGAMPRLHGMGELDIRPIIAEAAKVAVNAKRQGVKLSDYARQGDIAFTQSHWDALKRHGTGRVWIAYDRDDAGNAAADRLATELRESGVEAWRVLFPKGMDANDYARKVAPAEKSLGVLLQQAEWIGKGKRPGVAAQVEPVPGDDVKDVKQASSLVAAVEQAAPLAPVREESATREEAVCADAVTPSLAEVLDVKETASGELLFTFGERVWRIRGWQKNLGPEQMRVNAQVRRGESYHVDTLDVYSAKARGLFLKAAAVELGSQEDTLKRDLGRVLLKLETLQDEAIRATLAPKEKGVTLDAVEHAAALDWLKAPELIARLEADSPPSTYSRRSPWRCTSAPTFCCLMNTNVGQTMTSPWSSKRSGSFRRKRSRPCASCSKV